MGCVRSAQLTDIPQSVQKPRLSSHSLYGSFSEWVDGRKKINPTIFKTFFHQ